MAIPSITGRLTATASGLLLLDYSYGETGAASNNGNLQHQRIRATGCYVLFRPPEIVPWSVSSLLVEENNVWLGLVGRTEGAKFSAGLVRYDRNTGQVEKFQFIASGCASATQFCSYEVITQIKRRRDSLYLATHHGLLIFRNSQLTRYTFEPTINGGIEVHKINP